MPHTPAQPWSVHQSWPKLHVERLVHGGMGLARTAQGVVFLSDVAPDDTVEAVQTGRLGGCPVARTTRVVEASPARRTPPCPYAHECGGCDWQHIEYAAQLDAKKAIFLDCLSRVGKVATVPPIQVHESPEWGYRARARFKVDMARQRVGFLRRSSHDVVDIDACPLLIGPLNRLLSSRAQILDAIRTGATAIQVMATDDGTVVSTPVLDGLSTASGTIDVGSKRFLVGGSSFFQGNAFLREAMANWAARWLAPGGRWIDLFGGVGLFACCLGKGCARGTLVELDVEQTFLARDNLRTNGCTTWTAVAQSGEGFLREISAAGETVDCLIVDPPRAGLSPAVRTGIAAIMPKQILSVSCDAATHARDIGFFVNQHGYAIEQAALFDLYPQTHHLETVMLLSRGEGRPSPAQTICA
jgi:23S rRNA (uracil1939-C5)-methyltransferase